ncbi:pectate lyase B [Seiridium cupressi]
MMFFAAVAALAGLVAAVPTPTEDAPLDARAIEKRATITDAADVGTLAQFTAAAGSSSSYVIVVSGAISGAAKVSVKSNKSIIGKSGSSLTGIGLTINGQSNVIVRNLKISKVLTDYGDAITIQASKNVWVGHVDVSSDLNNGKDYYDGLIYIHDHYKASLVGHSDSNGDEDTSHLTVTYTNNYWNNVNSRTPSFRFGTGHIFNNYYYALGDSGINTREGAQLLVESSVFESSATKAIFSDDSDEVGYAVVSDVALGGSTNTAATGTLKSVPYSYTKLGSGSVKASVKASAGQTLSF